MSAFFEIFGKSYKARIMVVPILFTIDKSLEMPAIVCITSLIEHASQDTFYDIFILHSPSCDFSNSRLKELPSNLGKCRLTFRKVEGEFVGGYEIRGIPETAYYRLISPDLIPEYDRYLYSDVDVIFQDDMSKYYSLPLEGCYFAGVDSIPGINKSDRRYLTKSLKLNPLDGYFYSGNLIINAEAIRRDGKMDEFRSHRLKRYKYQDMDIINLTCIGKIKRLPPAFCLTTYLYDTIVSSVSGTVYSKEEIDSALNYGTIHFNGPKPWLTVCQNMDIWWGWYRKSIIFDKMYCRDFWDSQHHMLERLSFKKRIKMLLRFPVDKWL